MNFDHKKVQEQLLEELETYGELPPIALQVTGRMFHQHSEMMIQNEQEVQSMLGDNPNSASWPWGSWDAKSFEIQQYGSASVSEKEKNDPIHEVLMMRKQICSLTEELRNMKKRAMGCNLFVEDGKQRSDESNCAALAIRNSKRLKSKHI